MRNLALLLLILATAPSVAGQIVVTDRFDRELSARAVTLVDWEGHLANPAVLLRIDIPEAWKPATATITVNEPRVALSSRRYTGFEPSTQLETGPELKLRWEVGEPRDSFMVAIYPDRDFADEAHLMSIIVEDRNRGSHILRLPVLVRDQDRDRPLDFQVLLDTSHDPLGFFDDDRVRDITQQAADDWMYFLGPQGFDDIRLGANRSWIWKPTGFFNGYWTTNSFGYNGFLLYAWGMEHVIVHSGSRPSGMYQSVDGWPIDIMAGGYLAAERRGNFNVIGWGLDQSDSLWWLSRNLPGEVNDYYSIIRHEIAHALFFDELHLKFDTWQRKSMVDSEAVVAYYGKPVPVDQFDHFYGGSPPSFVEDPASRRGIFGSEYSDKPGNFTPYRWPITKLDVLLVEAMGYKLRHTSAFDEITFTGALPAATSGEAYSQVIVSGGVPDYQIEVSDGALPDGLSLDAFNGTIAGTPRTGGSYTLSVSVTDQMGDTATGSVTLDVSGSTSTDTESGVQPRALQIRNFPNPFQADTRIAYELATGAEVAVSIYDALGRRVAALVSGRREAGSHFVDWEAAALPPGLYIARIEASGHVTTTSMVKLP